MAKTSRNSRIWQIERASTTCVLVVVLVAVFCASAQTHPALGQYLNYWRTESVYNKKIDWIFASTREKGRVPRAASTCGKHYIGEDDHSRFGRHDLRHSLATFFGSNKVHPSVIQTMLRHSKQQTTALYIHSVNRKQVEAQGMYLEAIRATRRPWR
jgi:integrase